MPKTHVIVHKALKTWGLKLPGAHGESPWTGHDDLAPKKFAEGAGRLSPLERSGAA